MRRLYSILIWLLVPLLLLRLFVRGVRSPVHRERWPERLGFLRAQPGGPCIWLHAVSVGEVQAVSLLVSRLLEAYPELRMVITTTTPTGAQRVKELFGDQVRHYYAPFDTPFMVRRFFTALQPRLLILVETEIWPNLLHEARLRSVPSLLANARLSIRSARRYHKLSGFTRETLRNLSLIAAQGEADADRFLALGAHRAQLAVIGSIKYDMHLPASLRERADVLRRDWGTGRPVWLAASTHEGEDEQILQAHSRIQAVIPQCLLVLVPRHPARFDAVAGLTESFGFNLARRSKQQPCGADIGVFLGDTMGELSLFFGAADVAFIGGSLVPHGGHNLLEAAAHGVPVVFGPHMFNFAGISELFLDNRAAHQVHSELELAQLLLRWLSNASERSQVGERGRILVDKNRGALGRLTGLVARFI